MSKNAMYMSAKELLETFGVGKKGSRRVTGEMVAWLLTDPPRTLVDAAAILKAPIKHLPEAQPEPQQTVFKEFTFGAGYTGTN